ncbi:hypothetical protein GCM10009555_027680 [Acrocarpospora macrocephala]|uniref:Uncharacterized protein n=1 Tax=Acrocarpospora macrocephala TaxID=150177 RepID=A0A5M3X1G1_9ACTN|nr:hypothetical protein Amac_091520 [Acrocarpospora macrocephala]
MIVQIIDLHLAARLADELIAALLPRTRAGACSLVGSWCERCGAGTISRLVKMYVCVGAPPLYVYGSCGSC